MTILASLLLAAAAHGPQLLDAANVNALGVYESHLPSDRDGDVYVTLTVTPEGRPIHCDVAHSSGFRSLDAKTCAAMLRRARFAPARDEDGQPVASVYGAGMRWGPYYAGTPGYLIDMTVEVGKLPADAQQPIVAIDQLIAADGTLESCGIEQTSGFTKLDKLACKQAEGMAKLGPVKDAAGHPVRTLRVSRILFVEKPNGG